jgi:hypothetical protein
VAAAQPPTNRKADPKSTRRAFLSAQSWLTRPVGDEAEEDLMSVERGTRLAQLWVVVSKSRARARRVLGQDDAAGGGDAGDD